MDKKHTYEDLTAIADYLRTHTSIAPVIGIVCGSGLGYLVEDLDQDKPKDVIPYSDIPSFPQTTGSNLMQWHVNSLSLIRTM